jgi:vacuolar-type H+-ATPase subunit I/STV1
MFNFGVAVLVIACAALLSTLQEWALRRPGRVVRHFVAWLVGSLLVSGVVSFAIDLATGPRKLPPGAERPHWPDPMIAVFHWIVAIGVASALVAGVVHARQVGDDAHETVRDRWLGRAAVQGIALFVVGFVGFFLLLLVGLGQIH